MAEPRRSRGRELEPLFAPRGIAVIGASDKPGKLGTAMTASLDRFPRGVAMVNPGGGGMYTGVAEAVAAHGTHIDLAVLCVPAAATAGALQGCADAGVAAAVVCAGGFAEAGAQGEEHQQAVEAVVARTGIRLLGPNTSGFFRPGTGLYASFVPGAADLSPGGVGVVAASGGVNHALSFRLESAGAGVSLGVGLGGGIDVTAPEVLDFLRTDERTRAVALHLESVPDGPGLLEAVRRLAAEKPVAALVVGRGRTDEFARSHTGALATSWATTRALLEQAGAVVVDDENELVNAASALTAARMRPDPDPGVGLVTGQAGPGLIIADALTSQDLSLPPLERPARERIEGLLPPLTYLENPVDTGRPGPELPQVLAAVGADPGVDALGVYGITEPVVSLPDAVREAGVGTRIPVLIGVDGPAREVERVRAAADEQVPVLVGPSALAQGLTALAADARARHRAAQEVDRPARAPHLRLGDGPWHEAAAKDVLDSVGVATPRRRVCRTDEEVLGARGDLQGPVALKLLDASVLHKSDVGGVELGITGPQELGDALVRLRAAGARDVLVEEMAPSGTDLILGVRRDPVFGPVAVLGLGGVDAEALADHALCGLPAHRADLEGLPDRIAASALLDGFRGRPVLDRAALAEVVSALAGVLAGAPHVGEIEINPLRVTDKGLVALDAVMTPMEETR
ncbi:acetate--CoA ligase family protein [Nocardiopsis sp. HNM0947]|uniref:Acetate--CoA ligase family protein n=1 Tax=Nocardiopsis coralli TaxID=2772213 RepID=A0ABR9NZY6_9ACTN|nr:acetate--CoA ligase family protein [Nocardiopsis coralli]MBE2997134.1 acetate--CoA ligase family protein [Nocardiopsis coralli]